MFLIDIKGRKEGTRMGWQERRRQEGNCMTGERKRMERRETSGSKKREVWKEGKNMEGR